MSTILIQNGTLLTMNPDRDVLRGDILIEDGKISEMPTSRRQADVILDASGMLVLPGFIQVHVHLNQTLYRGQADDMDVVDWLRLRIWPFEKAHNYASIYASARLSIAEMIRGGTTSAFTIESLNDTEAAFEAARQMGFRAIIGNAMMDRWEEGTEMLGDDTQTALQKSLELYEHYHGSCEGRLGFAFCPRGTRNATDDLWREVGRLALERGVRVHSHAAENQAQTERLAQFGGREIHYLDKMGVLGPNLVLAHCVWLTEEEQALLAQRGAHVAHCPSANLKLASGIAPVPEMLDDGINVALGADGAPCNNNLDMFTEMRLAALIHKLRRGPKSMPAETVLEMATLGGARAMGLEDQIGSLEIGKKADVTLIRRRELHAWPQVGANPYAEIVYEHHASDVDTVLIDGKVVLRAGLFTNCDADEILRAAQAELTALLSRVA
jgi:cytosine/adenosine deaminase-related metal-dependent hydrolase